MSSAYEQARAAQIAKNLALLHSLQLPATVAAVTEAAASTPSARTKKRKSVAPPTDGSTPKSRRSFGPSSDAPSSSSRSSTRVKERIARLELGDAYQSEGGEELPSDYEDGDERSDGNQRRSTTLKGPRPDPKVFGNQVGVPVGKKWGFRIGASQDGIHSPVVAGISGSVTDGAWSIALSGGYEDDIDLGYAFTFTGSGGRDLKGTAAKPKNLRTAPQTSDQQFTMVNAAIKRSVETQKPIRVIRGFKGHSPFAPEEGYRYDGLYRCTKAWQDVGEAGFKVCRYSFVRLPGQPVIPIKAGREEEAAEILAGFGDSTSVPPTESVSVSLAPSSPSTLPSSPTNKASRA